MSMAHRKLPLSLRIPEALAWGDADIRNAVDRPD